MKLVHMKMEKTKWGEEAESMNNNWDEIAPRNIFLISETAQSIIDVNVPQPIYFDLHQFEPDGFTHDSIENTENFMVGEQIDRVLINLDLEINNESDENHHTLFAWLEIKKVRIEGQPENSFVPIGYSAGSMMFAPHTTMHMSLNKPVDVDFGDVIRCMIQGDALELKLNAIPSSPGIPVIPSASVFVHKV